MTDIVEKLEPCPFCGGEASMHSCSDPLGHWFAQCSKCLARSDIVYETRGLAAEIWNTRPAEPEIERLRAALHAIALHVNRGEITGDTDEAVRALGAADDVLNGKAP